MFSQANERIMYDISRIFRPGNNVMILYFVNAVIWLSCNVKRNASFILSAPIINTFKNTFSSIQ